MDQSKVLFKWDYTVEDYYLLEIPGDDKYHLVYYIPHLGGLEKEIV